LCLFVNRSLVKESMNFEKSHLYEKWKILKEEKMAMSNNCSAFDIRKQVRGWWCCFYEMGVCC
jgi:hypothetical protein